MSAKFLMCPPDHYTIASELNPWGNVKRPINQLLARTQWELLHKLITEQMSIHVELIKPVKGLPSMVFTANAGFVWKKTFVKSNLHHKERQPESAFFETWFKERGFEIVQIPKAHCFEGEPDVAIFGETLFCGYRVHAETQAHEILAEMIGKKLVSLEIVDERFFHLDACFLGLNDKTAIMYGPAFSGQAQQTLKSAIGNTILLQTDEAMNFLCNSIIIRKKIILPEKCQKTAQLLKMLGYQVFQINVSEFMKAGGNIKSLVLTLDRN